MTDETKWVTAYDRRTGRKLPHRVPEHFVTDLADHTNLSATPRGKAARKAVDTTEAAPAAVDDNTNKEK